ncbi:MAG: hypothetical protein HQ534_04330, partial [Armatimonadetes bacterium]|nr:hypothetical protein [Armatimonadota bacterium]
MKKFFIFVLLLSSILMFAQNTPNESTWVTNGAVEVILYADGITYIGGDFTQVGPVGGPMTTRNYLAAINASAGIATAWNPNPDAAVFALTAYGTTIFVGGNFRNIGGQPRNRLAAIDVNTGNVTSWNPNANNIVNALEVSGTTIYAGGYFTEIGGISRPYFAQLDASAPTLTTTSITTFDATSALMGGNVTDDGGATVFERGVVYSSTNTNPEIEGTDVTADSNG